MTCGHVSTAKPGEMTASTLPWLWRFYRLSHLNGENKPQNLSELRFAFLLSIEFISPSQDTLFNSISSQGDHAHPGNRGHARLPVAKTGALASHVFPRLLAARPWKKGGTWETSSTALERAAITPARKASAGGQTLGVLRGGMAAALLVSFDSRVTFTWGTVGCNRTAAWHKHGTKVPKAFCKALAMLGEPCCPITHPRSPPPSHGKGTFCFHIGPVLPRGATQLHLDLPAATLPEEQTLCPGPRLPSPAGTDALHWAASAPRALTPSRQVDGEGPRAGQSRRRFPGCAAGAAICSRSERGRSQPCHLQPSLATLGSTESALPACFPARNGARCCRQSSKSRMLPCPSPGPTPARG